MKIKFAFDEGKALAALAYIANEKPGLTPLFVAKIFFFAEKWHLNKYGRPIVADTYIAMPNGPVPSSVKNYLDENWYWTAQPDGFGDIVVIDRSHRLPTLQPGVKKPDFDILSETDTSCLQEAIAFCISKSAPELSKLTHYEKAWRNAEANQAMDYADFIDDANPHRAEIMKMVEESAAYGVL